MPLALSTGLFLGVVLYIYQGYNIQPGSSSSGHSLLFRSLLFAILTSTMFFTTELLHDHLKIRMPMVGRRLLQIFITATLVFLLYNYFWQWSDLKIISYLKLLAEFTGVMVIPLAFHYFVDKKTKDTAYEMLKISAANGKQVMRFPPI